MFSRKPPKTSPHSAPKSQPIASPYSAKKGASATSAAGSTRAPAAKTSASGSARPIRSQGGPRSPRPDRPAARVVQERVKLPVPCAQISRRASESLRRDHLWVYASDVEQVELGTGKEAAILPVVDNRGIPLGTALYSPTSQIALRMISRELLTMPEWLTQLAGRMREAIHRRTALLDGNTNACRLIFSEADQLPGIVVDRYADVAILQLLAKGLDNAGTREACIRVLREELADGATQLTLWERPDPRIRELEGLSAPTATALLSLNPAAPASETTFRLNGLNFHFDVNSGQKTGAFLDQRQNYAATETWARLHGAKKALDVCTYQGGFALHMARVCQHVTGVDASRSSLEVAERNLAANRDQIAAEVDWVEADAFELLRAWSDASNTADWDVIVLDPPAFAKSKRAVEGALRGYKELNLRALRMIRAGGLLVTCSCSHHVSWADLEATVAAAAVDSHRRVTLLERRGAAQDHPVLLNLPETEYLKCLICRVD